MKKTLCFWLVIALTAAMLAGCGNGTAEKPKTISSGSAFAKWFQADKGSALTNVTEPGTYYFKLGGNISVSQVGTINNGHTVVVDLNGHTITGGANQVFSVAGGGKLTLKNGTVRSAGADADGGVLYLEGPESQLNLEDVTLTNTDDTAIADKRYGGVIYACGTGENPATITIKGSTTINGSASAKRLCGGAVALMGNSRMYMLGGTVQGGQAGNGGNLYVDEVAQLWVSDGTISGGQTPNATTLTGDGGNIALSGQGQVHIYGGAVVDGTAKKNGGNVFVSCYGKNQEKGFYQYGGQIENGKATESGGNIYAMEKTTVIRLFGGKVQNGEANLGGNVCLAGSALEMYGGTLQGHENTVISSGGNIYALGGRIDLYDGRIAGGVTKDSGGNIFGENVTIQMYGGSIMAGASEASGMATGGGNLFLQGKSSFDMYDGEIAYGMTNQSGLGGVSTGPNVMIVGQTRMQMFGGSIYDGAAVGDSSRGQCVMVNGQVAGDMAVFHMYGGQLKNTATKSSGVYGHLAAAYSTSSGKIGLGIIRVFDGQIETNSPTDPYSLSRVFWCSRGSETNPVNVHLFNTQWKNLSRDCLVGDCTDGSHYTQVETVAATCVAPGYTKYHCNTCGDWCKITANATGHTDTVTEVAATEQLCGYTEHICSACGSLRRTVQTGTK